MQIATVSSFLLIYAESIGVGGLSYFFTIQAIAIIVTRPFVSKYIKNDTLIPFTLVGEVFIITGLILLFLTHRSLGFLIAACCFGLGKSLYQPALMSMCIETAGKENRGRASNTAYACNDIGQFLGSYLAGVFAAAFGLKYAFLGISLIIVLYVVIFVFAYIIPKQKRTDAMKVDDIC